MRSLVRRNVSMLGRSAWHDPRLPWTARAETVQLWESCFALRTAHPCEARHACALVDVDAGDEVLVPIVPSARL